MPYIYSLQVTKVTRVLSVGRAEQYEPDSWAVIIADKMSLLPRLGLLAVHR